MIGTKRTYRSATVILLGILLLAGSLLHRHILQTDASLPADAESGSHILSRGRSDPDRTSHEEAEIPAPDLVTAREIRGTEGGTVESVSWILPGERVAGVLAALEVGYHASRYRGRIESGRWHVESVIEGERPPGTPRSEALQQAFAALTGSGAETPSTDADTGPGRNSAAPSEASAARDGNTGTPDPDAGATRSGGSGYVLLRDRGRMHWMWNSDVLRLEPAR